MGGTKRTTMPPLADTDTDKGDFRLSSSAPTVGQGIPAAGAATAAAAVVSVATAAVGAPDSGGGGGGAGGGRGGGTTVLSADPPWTGRALSLSHAGLRRVTTPPPSPNTMNRPDAAFCIATRWRDSPSSRHCARGATPGATAGNAAAPSTPPAVRGGTPSPLGGGTGDRPLLQVPEAAGSMLAAAPRALPGRHRPTKPWGDDGCGWARLPALVAGWTASARAPAAVAGSVAAAVAARPKPATTRRKDWVTACGGEGGGAGVRSRVAAPSSTTRAVSAGRATPTKKGPSW